MRARRLPRGSALIEVLVAIVLLATAGTGLVTLLGQTSHSMRIDARVGAAHTACVRGARPTRRCSITQALLSRTGRSHSHGWTLDIDPLGQGLFDVRIAESDTTGRAAEDDAVSPAPDSADATP